MLRTSAFNCLSLYKRGRIEFVEITNFKISNSYFAEYRYCVGRTSVLIFTILPSENSVSAQSLRCYRKLEKWQINLKRLFETQ